MRSNSRASNRRKFRPFGSGRKTGEDLDWVMLEADLGKAQPVARRKGKVRSWLIRLLAVACLAISVPWGAKLVHGKIFYQNEEFVLQNLKIQTDGDLSESHLATIANVSTGMNLMELDLGAIEKRIGQLAVVEKVKVTREIPDKLQIFVKERVPIAWLSCPPMGVRPGGMDRGFLLDSEGFMFRCLDLTDGMMALPIVEAFKIQEPKEGVRTESESVRSALLLIVENDQVFLEDELGIHQVKCRNEWSLECQYRSGLTVKFALDRIDEGLADLLTIVEQTKHLEQPLAAVNVTVRKNIPVSFANEIDPNSISARALPLETVEESEGQNREKEQQKHLRSILKGG